MKYQLKLLALIATIAFTNSGFAQTNLIGKVMTERVICVGDTISFRFNSEILIMPLRTSEFNIYKNTPDNLNSYIGGYLSLAPVYANEKKKKNPVYAYKGSPQSNYTLSSIVANKKWLSWE